MHWLAVADVTWKSFAHSDQRWRMWARSEAGCGPGRRSWSEVAGWGLVRGGGVGVWSEAAGCYLFGCGVVGVGPAGGGAVVQLEEVGCGGWSEVEGCGNVGSPSPRRRKEERLKWRISTWISRFPGSAFLCKVAERSGVVPKTQEMPSGRPITPSSFLKIWRMVACQQATSQHWLASRGGYCFC